MAGRTPLFSRHQPGAAFMIADAGEYNGDVYFVHSGTGTDGAGYGRNPDAPVATLDYAVGLCTASKGDTILVMPGHAETISTSTGMVLDVAGVRVKGLGWGTLKPVFTFSATGSVCSITAANCWVENIRILGAVDNITAAISVGGSADGLVLKGTEIADGGAALEFLTGIAIATACHDISIINHRTFGLAGGATSALVFAGTSDRLVMTGCIMQGTFSGSLIDASAGILLNQNIYGNILHNRDTSAGLCYKGNGSSTGYLVENYVLGAKANTEPISTVTAMFAAENYGTDVAASTGILTPSTATAWS